MIRFWSDVWGSLPTAIELNPNYAIAYYNKGNTLSKLGKYDEALQAFNKAIELNPNDTEAYLHKGFTLCKLGREEEAIQAYNKAIEINS